MRVRSNYYPFFFFFFERKQLFFGCHLEESMENVLSGKGKWTVPRRDPLPLPLAWKHWRVSEICWEKHYWGDTLNICHETGGILPPWAEAWIALYTICAFFHTACICFPLTALAHMWNTYITLGMAKAIKCLVFPLPQVWYLGAKGWTCTPPLLIYLPRVLSVV